MNYVNTERSIWEMTLGKRLQYIRNQRRLYQKEVADYVGTSKSVISNYERDIRDPDTCNLRKMAEMYNVSTDYLLGLTDDPYPLHIDLKTFNNVMDSLGTFRYEKELFDWWINIPKDSVEKLVKVKRIIDILED